MSSQGRTVLKGFSVSVIAIMLIASTVALPAVAKGDGSQENVIVGFKGESGPDLIKKYKGSIKYEYSIIDAVAAEVPGNAVDALRRNPQVAYVEEDHKVHALGQTLPWGVDRIDADVVHGYPDKGSSETDIAIIDTGIDHDHPDLDDNYAGGYDFVNGDSDPMDDNGHGTHVSGIAAAEDNSIGVLGAAPEADLYGAKVLDSGGSGYVSDVVAGIEWAVEGPNGAEGDDDDAEVVSMSLGASEGTQSLEDAVNYAYSHGTLPVAAAGNDGNPPGKGDNVLYPARYDSVIAVAATDQNDERPRWSSTGPDVELSAPGVDIYSTYWDDTYATLSGTSMATPHVSGTAALVFNSPVTEGYDADGDGSWDPDEVRRKMDDTATDLGPSGRDSKYGYGLIQADEAVDEPKGHDLAVTVMDAPDWVVQGENATINVTVENQGSFDETSTLTLVDEYDGEEIGNTSVTLAAGSSKTYTFTWDTAGENAADHELNATVQPVENEIEIADNSGTTVVTVREPKHDLAVTGMDSPSSVTQNDTATIDVTVENQGTYDETSTLTLVDEYDGEEIGNTSVTLAAGSSKTYTFDWNTTGEATGNHTLNATVAPVTDETETADNSKTTTVEIVEPTATAPAIDKFEVSEVNSPSPHVEFEVQWSVSDDDGDLSEVRITLRSNSTGETLDSATESVSGSSASGTTTLKEKFAEGIGKVYDVTLSVTDEAGHTTSTTKTVEES